MRRDHHANEIIRHPPGRDHEPDPAQAEYKQKFRIPQSPGRADGLEKDIGTEHAQEERDQDAKIDMGKGKMHIADMETASQGENIDYDGQGQSDENGPRRGDGGGGDGHGLKIKRGRMGGWGIECRVWFLSCHPFTLLLYSV
jgi:hypothetical protein